MTGVALPLGRRRSAPASPLRYDGTPVIPAWPLDYAGPQNATVSPNGQSLPPPHPKVVGQVPKLSVAQTSSVQGPHVQVGPQIDWACVLPGIASVIPCNTTIAAACMRSFVDLCTGASSFRGGQRNSIT